MNGQRVGPGRVAGATIEVRIGDTWQRMEPVLTPLGAAILAFVEGDPEPCPVCGYFACICESPCDPHGDVDTSVEIP